MAPENSYCCLFHFDLHTRNVEQHKNATFSIWYVWNLETQAA